MCREYFQDNSIIKSKAQAIYDRVEWNWMVDQSAGDHQYQFYLAWTPEQGFIGHADGYTDEALLVDILGLGSSTHWITIETYNARSRYFGSYPTGSPSIAASWTGSLFTYFFGNCWLDLQNRGEDCHSSYPLDIWENNRKAVVANRQFCIDHDDDNMWDGDDRYTTYNSTSWGLTASDNMIEMTTGCLSEYYAFGSLPTEQVIRGWASEAPHCGTIAVYGAAGAILFVPNQAIQHSVTITQILVYGCHCLDLVMRTTQIRPILK